MKKKINIYKIVNNVNVKRKDISEFKSMKKDDLIKSLWAYVLNFDKLRMKYVDILLENRFLSKRISLLEDKLFLNSKKKNLMYVKRYVDEVIKKPRKNKGLGGKGG